MRRKRMSSRKSRRSFRNKTRINRRNRVSVMRGGYRL